MYLCCMRKLLYLLPIVMMTACGDTDPQQAADHNDTLKTAPPADPMPMPDDVDTSTTGLGPALGDVVDGEYVPGTDEVVGYYELLNIQEAGYPQFSIEVSNARGDRQTFYLNAREYKGSSITDLSDSTKRKVKIAYWVRYQNNVAKILSGQDELVSHEEVQPEPEFEKATGILVADEIATGDAMSMFVIAKQDGTQIYFPYHVTQMLTAHNGEEVTVYYTAEAEPVISYIHTVE